MPPASWTMIQEATVMPMYWRVTFRRFDWLADHMPPIRAMPMKTTALISMPVRGVKKSGRRAERMAPPATNWRLMMTSWTRIWQAIPAIMLFLP